MKAATYDAGGTAGSETGLPEDLFDGTVNRDVLHQVVTAIQGNARHGTASSKGRTDVRGGSRKPWRQKGTGRARQGTIRAPQWRGGGVVFGPSPRSFSTRVPKSMRRLATRSALNARALEGELAIIEALELDAPRTKTIAELLDGIGTEGRNVLILTAGNKPNVYLSARNIPRVLVRPWGEASAYDVLWSDLVLVESGAFAETADAPAPASAEAPEESVTDATEEPETAGHAEADADDDGGES